MRKGHIIFGLITFSIGLFLSYLNSAFIVVFIKGIIQPIFIILGIISLLAAFLGKKNLKTINLILSIVFLLLGGYGLYDEYYAVVDFISGFLPVFLVIGGVAGVVHGVKELT
ncbi:MAG: hypothetical protein HQK78_12560 [Desulfobacterales bacterium]|nr:hypothetical protein [Desulfobacterales bacterium]